MSQERCPAGLPSTVQENVRHWLAVSAVKNGARVRAARHLQRLCSPACSLPPTTPTIPCTSLQHTSLPSRHARHQRRRLTEPQRPPARLGVLHRPRRSQRDEEGEFWPLSPVKRSAGALGKLGRLEHAMGGVGNGQEQLLGRRRPRAWGVEQVADRLALVAQGSLTATVEHDPALVRQSPSPRPSPLDICWGKSWPMTGRHS